MVGGQTRIKILVRFSILYSFIIVQFVFIIWLNYYFGLKLLPQSMTHATNPTSSRLKSCSMAIIRLSFSPLVVALVRPRNSPLGGVKENCNAGDQIKDGWRDQKRKFHIWLRGEKKWRWKQDRDISGNKWRRKKKIIYKNKNILVICSKEDKKKNLTVVNLSPTTGDIWTLNIK